MDGSEIVVEGPWYSLRSRKVYSDLYVDYLKMFLLNVLATFVAFRFDVKRTLVEKLASLRVTSKPHSVSSDGYTVLILALFILRSTSATRTEPEDLEATITITEISRQAETDTTDILELPGYVHAGKTCPIYSSALPMVLVIAMPLKPRTSLLDCSVMVKIFIVLLRKVKLRLKGAHIKVCDATADCDECIVTISSTVEAVLLVQQRNSSSSTATVTAKGLSGRIRKLLLEAKDTKVSRINLTGLPGRSDAFELAANFCYGVNVEITISNVALLRCAARFMKMTEDISKKNLEIFTELINTIANNACQEQLTSGLSKLEYNFPPKPIQCVDSETPSDW
ncbi:hypothetical protein T459_26247 [Capsicum annuum]|uniref:BTB/POZ domain-containing protein n=1 Tax=Capsicum annuum TaxID=4072 RepID=A0A2G2YN03_CAPAN|nr:hypothetical protein T459_26247 [Capsicum annuum]